MKKILITYLVIYLCTFLYVVIILLSKISFHLHTIGKKK